MLYLIGVNAFGATRSFEHFWSGILDPVGFLYSDAIARYWTVVERNSQLFSWSVHVASGVFLYNRLLWGSVGLLSLVVVWRLFPMSVETLTARISGKQAARAREQELVEARPPRSLVAARLPTIHQVFGPGTTFLQLASLTRLRVSNIVREIPFLGHSRPYGGNSHHQWSLRRPRGRSKCLARHLPYAPVGRRWSSTLLLDCGDPLRCRTYLARARYPIFRYS
jgi:hypothetical protein